MLPTLPLAPVIAMFTRLPTCLPDAARSAFGAGSPPRCHPVYRTVEPRTSDNGSILRRRVVAALKRVRLSAARRRPEAAPVDLQLPHAGAQRVRVDPEQCAPRHADLRRVRAFRARAASM